MLLPSQPLESTPSYSNCPPNQLNARHFIITKYLFLPLHLKTGYVTFKNPFGFETPLTIQAEFFFFCFARSDFSLNTETKGRYLSQGQFFLWRSSLPCLIRAVVVPKELTPILLVLTVRIAACCKQRVFLTIF